MEKPQAKLLNSLKKQFELAIAVVEKLPDNVYFNKETNAGGVGAHFRHNFDFADKFLKGIEGGRINYADRDRNLVFERDRIFAISCMSELVNRFNSIFIDDLSQEILVCSEVDESFWHRSTISRELEFVNSHTVHHHALIVEKLKTFGIDSSLDFGVAPSTLKYWSRQKSA